MSKQVTWLSASDRISELESGLNISMLKIDQLKGRIKQQKEYIDSLLSVIKQQENNNIVLATEGKLPELLKWIADLYGVEVQGIKSKIRTRKYVEPRQMYCFVAKRISNASLKAIASHIGGRDHATIIYSCRIVQGLMDVDLEFRSKVETICSKAGIEVMHKIAHVLERKEAA